MTRRSSAGPADESSPPSTASLGFGGGVRSASESCGGLQSANCCANAATARSRSCSRSSSSRMRASFSSLTPHLLLLPVARGFGGFAGGVPCTRIIKAEGSRNIRIVKKPHVTTHWCPIRGPWKPLHDRLQLADAGGGLVLQVRSELHCFVARLSERVGTGHQSKLKRKITHAPPPATRSRGGLGRRGRRRRSRPTPRACRGCC